MGGRAGCRFSWRCRFVQTNTASKPQNLNESRTSTSTFNLSWKLLHILATSRDVGREWWWLGHGNDIKIRVWVKKCRFVGVWIGWVHKNWESCGSTQAISERVLLLSNSGFHFLPALQSSGKSAAPLSRVFVWEVGNSGISTLHLAVKLGTKSWGSTSEKKKERDYSPKGVKSWMRTKHHNTPLKQCLND